MLAVWGATTTDPNHWVTVAGNWFRGFTDWDPNRRFRHDKFRNTGGFDILKPLNRACQCGETSGGIQQQKLPCTSLLRGFRQPQQHSSQKAGVMTSFNGLHAMSCRMFITTSSCCFSCLASLSESVACLMVFKRDFRHLCLNVCSVRSILHRASIPKPAKSICAFCTMSVCTELWQTLGSKSRRPSYDCGKIKTSYNDKFNGISHYSRRYENDANHFLAVLLQFVGAEGFSFATRETLECQVLGLAATVLVHG